MRMCLWLCSALVVYFNTVWLYFLKTIDEYTVMDLFIKFTFSTDSVTCTSYSRSCSIEKKGEEIKNAEDYGYGIRNFPLYYFCYYGN